MNNTSLEFKEHELIYPILMDEKLKEVEFPQMLENEDDWELMLLDYSEIEYRDEEETSQGGVFQGIGSVFKYMYKTTVQSVFQSEEAEDIRWKIDKYETVLIRLRKGVENILNSDLKISYEELKVQDVETLSPLQSYLSRVVVALFDQKIETNNQDRLTQQYLSSIRQCYGNFIVRMREAAHEVEIQEKKIEGEDILFRNIIDKICEFRMRGVNFKKCCEDTVETFYQMGKRVITNLNLSKTPTLREEVEYYYECIRLAPITAKAPILNQLGNSLKGYFNLGFDPDLQANIPHQWFTLELGCKNVDMFVCGSPTIEWPTQLNISDNFKGFLRHCRTNHQIHLYVSLQNTIPVSKQGYTHTLTSYIPEICLGPIETVVGGDETNRSQSIFGLEESFSGNFYVMGLSKNSDWYYQKNQEEQINEYPTFKKKFLRELFELKDVESGNYISKLVKESYKKNSNTVLQEWCSITMDAIYFELFGNDARLEKADRKIFIELLYYFLELEIAIKLGVDSMNTSCKDDIDRGICERTKMYVILKIINGEELNVKELMTQLFARALMVRKRPIIKDRLERLLEVVEFVIKKQKEVRKLHQIIFPKLSCKVVIKGE